MVQVRAAVNTRDLRWSPDPHGGGSSHPGIFGSVSESGLACPEPLAVDAAVGTGTTTNAARVTDIRLDNLTTALLGPNLNSAATLTHLCELRAELSLSSPASYLLQLVTREEEVFASYGRVELVHIIGGLDPVLAHVVLETKHEATDAFGELHGRNIYDSCCQLDIQWCSSQDPRNTNLAFSCGDTMVTTAAARPATSVLGQDELSNTNNSIEVATTFEIVSGVTNIAPPAPVFAKAAGDTSLVASRTYSNVKLHGISVGDATLQLPTSTVDSDDSSEEPYELVEAPVSTPLEDFKLISACALEAFQLISGCSKSVSNYLTYNGLEGTHIKVIEFVRDNDYLVCGPGSIVQLDTSSTLSDFIKMLEEHPKLQLSKAIVMHEGNNMYMQLRKVLEHMTWTNLSVPMFELLKEVPYTIASDRSCTQLEFDIAGTGLTYESSNCIGVYTENCPGVVEEAERWLGYSPDS
ncbi:hypothetical protein ZEAMMB73_Zm00001d013379, partial [Zea mays]